MPVNAVSTAECAAGIRAAQVVVPCASLARTIECLTDLGFIVDTVVPADSPTIVIVSGHGVTLRLEQGGVERAPPVTLRLLCDPVPQLRDAMQRELAANGIDVQFAEADPAVEVPAAVQQFVVTRLEGEQSWHVGRAGMLYRDLIPDRLGGCVIASHIRVPGGGEVPDYVHYHRIRFQMIYCRSGWARLVYEDQGEPFLFSAGDCVLQPPEIRHRVLETSAGFEVIEVGCPALHATHADHRLELPTGRTLPDRHYGTQRFVHHVAAAARWRPWLIGGSVSGFEARDTGIANATSGVAGASVVRCTHDDASTPIIRHAGEFRFLFVLRGVLALRSGTLGDHRLAEADCCVIPALADFALTGDRGLEWLEVSMPGIAGDSASIARHEQGTRPDA